MIRITRGESYPIFFNIKQDGYSLTPNMILDLEIHIEEFEKSYLGGGVFFDQTSGRWYIFPSTAETESWEEGSHVVCAHFTYHNGETYIKEAGRIMVNSCG